MKRLRIFADPEPTSIATRITEKLGQAVQPNMPVLVKEFHAILKSGQALLKQIDQYDEAGRPYPGELGKLRRTRRPVFLL